MTEPSASRLAGSARRPGWALWLEAGLWGGCVLASVLAAAWLPAHRGEGLRSRLWASPDFTGPSVALNRTDVPRRASVATRASHLTGNAFSVAWSGYFAAEQTGRYRFELDSDDGSWLLLSGAVLIDNGGVHGTRRVGADVDLAAGVYPIEVRYAQAGGDFELVTRWTPPGQSIPSELPRRVLTAEAADARRVVAAARLELVRLALPMIWAMCLLYIPARLAATWLWREVRRSAPSRRDLAALGLALTLLVGQAPVAALWSWAPDEVIAPSSVSKGLEMRFSGGWHEPYTPLHFYLAAFPMSGFALADRTGLVAMDEPGAQHLQVLAVRAVTLVMSAATLVLAYLIAAEAFGVSAAWLAPFCVLLSPLFLYYSKTSNTEVPYLMWLAVALLGYIRIFRHNRLGDYVLLATGATCAVCSKDQSAGYFVLIPVALAVFLARSRDEDALAVRLWRAVFDRRMLAGAGTAAALFVLLCNLPLNWDGYRRHLEVAFALGQGFAMVPRTAAGCLQLGGIMIEVLGFAMGWPLLAAGVGGAAAVLWRRRGRLALVLWIPCVSYYVTFLCYVGYCYDRFAFGIQFVLALFAAAGLDRLIRVKGTPARLVSWPVVFIVAGYSLMYSGSMLVMMARDSRWDATRWLDANVDPAARVMYVGPYYLLPLMHTGAVGPVAFEVADLVDASPDFIVTNQRTIWRTHPQLRDWPEAGTLGYRVAYRHVGPVPAWALLQRHKYFRDANESGRSNLDKVNPPIVIYAPVRPQLR
jgi:4-amino-4-deoxy-L-arabinose transferase-like glycosyltransferase